MRIASKIVRRTIFIGACSIIVIVLALGAAAWFQHADDPPSIKDAPWAIQTSSRIYYAREVSSIEGVPAIRGYWYSDGGWYHYQDEIKEFPEDLYPKLNIIRREK